MESITYYIGWDVSDWNCEKNRNSRDAIVIVDNKLQIIGTPWRGNLKQSILESDSVHECVGRLFDLCREEYPGSEHSIFMGIDTPLGFPKPLIELLVNKKIEEDEKDFDRSQNNPYLFRYAERFLSQYFMETPDGRKKLIQPLSAIKDMIGSQATKGIHVLVKYSMRNEDDNASDIWRSVDRRITFLEVYPSVSRCSKSVNELYNRGSKVSISNKIHGKHQDIRDAVYCALTTLPFDKMRDKLMDPPKCVSKLEGWIWVPRDALIGK